MNQVNLIGRLVADPEMTVTPNGVSLCKFTLAVNKVKKGQDGQDADFLRCVSFNKTAENLVNYQKKGSQIGVNGSISTGSYVDKDNKTIYTTDILVNQITFLGSKSEGQAPQQQAQTQQPAFGQQPVQQQFNAAPQGFTQQQNFGHQAPQFGQPQQQQDPNWVENNLPF